MKFLLSFLLTVGSAIGLLPLTVYAQEFTEDFLQVNLDELGLRTFSGAQPLSESVLTSAQGVDYPLSDVVPYTALFASSSFQVSEDGLSVTHKRTNETFRVPVFRSMHDNNTVVQLFTEEDGTISYAEIRGEDKEFDTFFVATSFLSAANGTSGEDLPKDILLSFMADDIDEDQLNNFTLSERVPPLATRRLQNHADNGDDDSLEGAVERFSAFNCDKFRAVKIAVTVRSFQLRRSIVFFFLCTTLLTTMFSTLTMNSTTVSFALFMAAKRKRVTALSPLSQRLRLCTNATCASSFN